MRWSNYYKNNPWGVSALNTGYFLLLAGTTFAIQVIAMKNDWNKWTNDNDWNAVIATTIGVAATLGLKMGADPTVRYIGHKILGDDAEGRASYIALNNAAAFTPSEQARLLRTGGGTGNDDTNYENAFSR